MNTCGTKDYFIVSENKGKCMICGHETNLIDPCAEAYLCSPECEEKFIQMMTEYEREHPMEIDFL